MSEGTNRCIEGKNSILLHFVGLAMNINPIFE
jgi:hypothetical protein